MEKIQQEYYQDFIFSKVKIDENHIVAQQYGISSIPTTLFLNGGQFLRKIVGVVNYVVLKQVLEKFRAE